ncbi:hypothetical protein NE237_018310 [Protea cynaroides]|uniref:ABC transporter domain-containing protein n=1 Tax=Protea cynaroides TaxID=273540 RepID=A0A9Q0K9M0_9MAGN|nr:hypothetical protein NE237_018310 [Protea cynaroides]
MASPIRWTPSPSPTRSTKCEKPTKKMMMEDDDDIEMDSCASDEGNPSAVEMLFPFSTNTTLSLSPAPLLQRDSEITSHEHGFHIRVPSLRINSGERISVGRDHGVKLTWEDLWVTVSDRKEGSREILQGLTGYAQPGELLAIMGPSGCGKSTLLDALSGRLGSNTRQSGKVLVNGRKQTLSFGASAYVTQDDTLMTTLTVREAVYYSAQLQLPDSMPKAKKKERAETTIREMGLQDAINTRIGGWSIKGLSGGQKRRVSICIEILTRPKLLFLDEPTSGLDSAASYHVMKRIAGLCQQHGRTVIASIHQPSSEVFELFRNLCLLANGRTVYFGPASGANEFFALNGFPCPTLRNPSDHFLRTINKDFELDIEQGPGTEAMTIEEAIRILIQSYKLSATCQQVQTQVAEICKREGAAMEKKGRQAGFLTQSIVLTTRSFVNMHRDLGYYWLRFAIYVALCLCVGTVYYNVGHSYGSIQARGSMLMFVAAFLTFMAIGGFPSFVEDMKIFQRERLNGHYGVGAFVIGNTLSSIPYLILNSLIPGVIAYYLVGLQRGIDHFVYFALVLFTCIMLVESLMMIVASIVPDFLLGIITGAGIQGVMMLVGGGSATITGDEILRNTWEVEMGYSKWIDLAILFGMVVVYRLMFFGIIKSVEKLKPIIGASLAVPPKQKTHITLEPSRTQVKM